MQCQRYGHLSAESLSVRPSPQDSHDPRTERRGEEKACDRCFSAHRKTCACEPSCQYRAFLRWAKVLLTDDFLCRSKILPCKLPWREDGRRPEWNSVRKAVVFPLGPSSGVSGKCGLTLRSSGRATAARFRPSFHSGPYAPCRREPLMSNVSRRKQPAPVQRVS